MKKRTLLLAAALVGAMAIIPLHSAFATQNGEGHIPVTLCHRTGAWAGGNQHNGYDLITVDLSSISGIAQLNGHDGHEQVRHGPGPDIIPPVTYTVLNGPDKGTVVNYPGKGLDWVFFEDGSTGAEFLANGCTFNEVPPTSPPPTSTPPVPPEINPAASLVAGDCEHQVVQATLDNRASTDGSDEGGTAQFLITVNGEQFADVYNVSAGEIAAIDVPVVDGDIVNVYDARGPVDEHSLLASVKVDLSACNHTQPPPPNNPNDTPPSTPPVLPETL